MPRPRRPPRPHPRQRPNPAETLVAVASLTTRWVERLLAGNDPPLTPAQFLALRAIAAEPLAAAELARRTGVSGAAVSQLVAALEREGWVERSPEAADRRRHVLALTPTGLETLQSATRLVYGRLGELLSELPRHDAQELTRLLTRVEHVLGGSPPPRRPPPPPPRRP
jgi:DNA-binding MarR family transcriptional regulator